MQPNSEPIQHPESTSPSPVLRLPPRPDAIYPCPTCADPEHVWGMAFDAETLEAIAIAPYRGGDRPACSAALRAGAHDAVIARKREAFECEEGERRADLRDQARALYGGRALEARRLGRRHA